MYEEQVLQKQKQRMANIGQKKNKNQELSAKVLQMKQESERLDAQLRDASRRKEEQKRKKWNFASWFDFSG